LSRGIPQSENIKMAGNSTTMVQQNYFSQNVIQVLKQKRRNSKWSMKCEAWFRNPNFEKNAKN
jgi:hypothetical protein